MLHDGLVAAISQLSDVQVLPIAQAWAATEEWQRDGGGAASLAEAIQELRRLARQALVLSGGYTCG